MPERIPLLRTKLSAFLEELYAQGYRRFFDGAALGFDMLAAECVLQLQTKHPDVILLLAIPCAEQAHTWPAAEQARYQRICYCADEQRVLAPHYYNGCMQARNRYMVDRSAYCICYMEEMRGGTAHTVAYALRQELPVVNLAMKM